MKLNEITKNNLSLRAAIAAGYRNDELAERLKRALQAAPSVERMNMALVVREDLIDKFRSPIQELWEKSGMFAAMNKRTEEILHRFSERGVQLSCQLSPFSKPERFAPDWKHRFDFLINKSNFEVE